MLPPLFERAVTSVLTHAAWESRLGQLAAQRLRSEEEEQMLADLEDWIPAVELDARHDLADAIRFALELD